MCKSNFYGVGVKLLMDGMTGFDEPNSIDPMANAVIEEETENADVVLNEGLLEPQAEVSDEVVIGISETADEENAEPSEVASLNDDELQEKIVKVRTKILALPKKIEWSGHKFVWEEKFDLDKEKVLRIIPEDRTLDFTLDINYDGSINNYSFWSTSGKSDTDAKKTENYLKVCSRILSEEFRKKISDDYQKKLPKLEVLNAECEALLNEKYTREGTLQKIKKEQEEKEKIERRLKYEKAGQIWFNYQRSETERLIVKSVTEKFVIFNLMFFSTTENKWVVDESGATLRYAKHLLGFMPDKKLSTAVRPVGTDDITTQSIGNPETVDY